MEILVTANELLLMEDMMLELSSQANKTNNKMSGTKLYQIFLVQVSKFALFHTGSIKNIEGKKIYWI